LSPRKASSPPRADDLETFLAARDALDVRIAAAPALAQRVLELRAWQSSRLAQTYDDLRRDPRYAPAVEFLLSDLYGTKNVAPAYGQLRRAWRFMRRALPRGAIEVLGRAIALDVLTAELDLAMAEHTKDAAVTAASYGAAYRQTGQASQRQRQIDLTIAIGEDLDRFVRRSWVPLAIRAAHGPAHAAGFGELQDMLERGCAAFRRMRGAQFFLDTIRERETRVMKALLDARSPS
jgi:hypothetical protein